MVVYVWLYVCVWLCVCVVVRMCNYVYGCVCVVVCPSVCFICLCRPVDLHDLPYSSTTCSLICQLKHGVTIAINVVLT